jgi:hypothetical protein
MLEGFGKMLWGDGKSYIGEFKQDSFNGYGIYRMQDGKVYQG